MTTSREFGVLHQDGRVEKVDSADANEAYMSSEQFARVRADAVGGRVVTRTRTVTLSKWANVL